MWGIAWIIFYAVCASITFIWLWHDTIKELSKVGLGTLTIVIVLSVLWPIVVFSELMELADRKIIVYSRKKEK